MNKYYFTFGIGQPLQNFYQIIVAENEEQARKKMFKEWGKTWAFSYSEEEFGNAMQDGHFTHLKPLEPLYEVAMMTVGEMKGWTERFNQILGGAQCNVERRLIQMRSDLVGAYDYDDIFTHRFLKTVEEVI